MNVTPSLHDAIENAKNFENFDDVLMAVNLHPEWLTMIPERRSWAILHHIVFSGNIDHLDRLLALQKSNKHFRLLTKTNKNETVLDIAALQDDETEMLKRIERLIKLDELLNYARECDWNKCYEIVKENPSYGNEKPPYRRYYLIHHMACANAIREFERFKRIENFKFNLTLRADRKKINIIAREGGYEEFAQYIEKQNPSLFTNDDSLYEPSEEAKKHTNKINILMEQRDVAYEPDMSLGPLENKKTRQEANNNAAQKLSKLEQKNQPAISKNNPTNVHPVETILDILKCSLTNAIVTDPVVAADGFTYERSAIENWLESHDHSPMTNEKLSHKNLNPNYVVKQILSTITQP